MKLLLVEDNDGLREQMKWALCDAYEILEADSSFACMEKIKQEECRMVCLDMGLDNVPDKGLEVIDLLLKQNRTLKIIVITANTEQSLGKESIAKGAFDFLTKPVNIEELKVILQRAERLLHLEEPVTEVKTDGFASEPGYGMIGECGAMKQIFETIRKLSLTDVNVLITGESGTGKELCARAIHSLSARNTFPFVPINSSAIPETLLESELFGYTKGAFTGAQSNKAGLIESANKGTLFLDEIGDMPGFLQAKLLRFLEDQKFQRLGDVTLYQADVRIIAATNKKESIGQENPSMRSDLYFRLSEFEIFLPPLRERGSDIMVLTERILTKNRERFNMPKLKISKRTEQVLMQYTWPGNVRELENKLGRAAISCVNQIIESEDLNLVTESIGNLSFKEAKNIFEKNFIISALRQTNYNISNAAKNIGLTRPTLYDLMKKHDITVRFEGKLED